MAVDGLTRGEFTRSLIPRVVGFGIVGMGIVIKIQTESVRAFTAYFFIPYAVAARHFNPIGASLIGVLGDNENLTLGARRSSPGVIRFFRFDRH